MALTKYEQETHASMNREDDYAVIDTANARHIRVIEKDDRFTIVKRVVDHDTGELISVIAHISLDHFDVIGGVKRRQKPLTDAEKQILAERMAKAREARNG